MRQVQEEELSALLDGELETGRAEEVRVLIAADPFLRAQYDALARLDSRLTNAAETLDFMPDIQFPAVVRSQTLGWRWPAASAGILALIAVRLVPKLAGQPLFGVAVQIVVCALIAFFVVRMARETSSSLDKEMAA